MVLHICKPETIRVIEEIARRTGHSAERVVETAVYEYRARLRTPEEEEKRRQRLQALVDSLAARFEASGQPLVDHGDLLYDENGLPREGELSEVELRFYFPERCTSPEGSDDDQE
jgi:antitoxin VapB